MMSKITRRSVGIFILFSFFLGAAAGSIVWLILRVMSIGIEFVWHTIPGYLGNSPFYTFAVCIIGGVIIGLWQRKFGILPESLEIVMDKLKSEGTYPYNRLHILAIAALLPLIFGGSLGPEAGLTGIIVGLCCWVGDKLKYKGAEVKHLAEAGITATLGIIFNAPFFGIANQYEHEFAQESEQDLHLNQRMKKARTMVYVAAVVGGFGAMKLLGTLFGGSMGLSRFSRDITVTSHEWKCFILFAAASIFCGMLFLSFDKFTSLLSDKIIHYRITSCVLAGLFLATIGTLFPWTMFSGEHEMGEIMKMWDSMSVTTLMLTSIMKLLLINLCVNFGWRGGNIFPIIFSGVCMGFALAGLTGAEPTFAVAVVTAGLCGYIMRKPITVVAVLLLCFPITVLIPTAVAAYIGSIVPVLPFMKKREAAETHTG